jgi:NDP-sugar pyrophosphorylase family protein
MCSIVPPTSSCLADIDVLILAGGLGTRLAGVLPGTPKVLAPVGDKVFLDLLLAQLRRFGARRVILSLGHLAPVVEAHVAALGIETVVEPEPRGTAGAIRFARPHLRSQTVVIVNGDSLIDADLCRFVEAHRVSGTIGSLLCTRVPDAARFGTIEIADGRIQAFEEKTGLREAGTINAGVYGVERALLDRIDAMPGPSLERDVFQRLPPGTLGGYVGDFPFIDIGTPDDLARAAGFLAR